MYFVKIHATIAVEKKAKQPKSVFTYLSIQTKL